MRNAIRVTAALALAGCASSALAQDVVVNIDFEGASVGDTNHVGADGALSTTGTVWNSVVVTGPATVNDLADEFGTVTPFGIGLEQTPFPNTDPSSTNNLQDSGIGSGFIIFGLLPNATYDVVGYVGPNGGFNVDEFGGLAGFQGFGDPTYALPGTQGGGPGDDPGDYMLFEDLVPYQLGNGDYALGFQLDGMITGLQIRGPIPSPATALLAGIAGVPSLIRRRR